MTHLDGLRALAVLGPIFHHLYPRATGVEARLVHLGSLGVDVFFVLSGFLISLILIDARDDPSFSLRTVLRSFYLRRFVRIVPVYWLLLAAALLAALLPTREFFIYALYATNFHIAAVGEWPGEFSHLWSLAVEEQFYLIWPWLILLVPRHRLRGLMLATVGVGLLWRTAFWMAPWPSSSFVATLWPFGCIDEFAMGGLLALEWRRPSAGFVRALPFIYAVCLALTLAHVSWWIVAPTAPASLLAMSPVFRSAVAGTVMGFLGLLHTRPELGRWAQLLSWTPLVYVGRVSYGVYLVHYFVPGLLEWAHIQRTAPLETVGQRLVWIGTVFAVSILIASASWFLIEKPLGRLKGRWPYTRATGR